MNKKSSYLGRFQLRIKLARITNSILVAAEKRSSFTPPAAAKQRAGAIRDVIRPVKNEIGINAEDSRNRRFDLLIGISFTTQAASGFHNEMFDCCPVVEIRFSNQVVHTKEIERWNLFALPAL